PHVGERHAGPPDGSGAARTGRSAGGAEGRVGTAGAPGSGVERRPGRGRRDELPLAGGAARRRAVPAGDGGRPEVPGSGGPGPRGGAPALGGRKGGLAERVGAESARARGGQRGAAARGTGPCRRRATAVAGTAR